MSWYYLYAEMSNKEIIDGVFYSENGIQEVIAKYRVIRQPAHQPSKLRRKLSRKLILDPHFPTISELNEAQIRILKTHFSCHKISLERAMQQGYFYEGIGKILKSKEK